MFRRYLERGLLTGAVGGLVFGLFVALVGNPLVHAIEEEALAGHASAHHGDTANSAATTALTSIGGGVLWGLLLGAVAFGAVYYFLEPALPGSSATKRYALAGAGFITVSGGPWLVLPPRPAGVESALSTDARLLWYGGMVVAGALACLLAGLAYARLDARGVGRLPAGLAALTPFAALAVPVFFAPATPTGDASAALTAAYRGFVVFGQAGLWFVLASVHVWFGRRDTGEAAETETNLSVDEPISMAD